MPNNSLEILDKTTPYAYFGSSEGPMRSLPRRAPIIVPPGTSVRNAMLQMNQLGNDSVVVVDDASKLPLGIVTQSDLVHAIAFRGEDLEQPVAALMTAAPFT
ncbi:MAG: CBS domain-containing protein, partial [Gammaproteobacteria bacterium]|nr:CBS domain-containing protein [Gammaproteobacteria bacterium]